MGRNCHFAKKIVSLLNYEVKIVALPVKYSAWIFFLGTDTKYELN